MPSTLEERVAYLEGKVEEHSSAWQDLREAIRETSQRIIHLEQKFDQRFIQMDQRLNETNQRIDKLFWAIIATLVSSIGALISAIVNMVVK